MNWRITVLAIIFSITLSCPAFAQDPGQPPPPPGSHSLNGNQDNGGGAPIGGGGFVLLLMAFGYATYKGYKMYYKFISKETTNKS